MPEPAYKHCPKCGEDKPLAAFYRRTRSIDGRMACCKSCDDARKTADRRADPKRYEMYCKRWRDRNPDKQAAIEERARRKAAELHPKRAAEAAELHRKRHPEKSRARGIVRQDVYLGKIVKPDCCEGCGTFFEDARKLHGHHDDYSKPREVDWLCKDCHAKRHAE